MKTVAAVAMGEELRQEVKSPVEPFGYSNEQADLFASERLPSDRQHSQYRPTIQSPGSPHPPRLHVASGPILELFDEEGVQPVEFPRDLQQVQKPLQLFLSVVPQRVINRSEQRRQVLEV